MFRYRNCLVNMWLWWFIIGSFGGVFGGYFEETEFDDPFMTLGRIAQTHMIARDNSYFRNTVTGVCNTTSTGTLNFGMCRNGLNCTIDGGTYSSSGTNNCVWGNKCCLHSSSRCIGKPDAFVTSRNWEISREFAGVALPNTSDYFKRYENTIDMTGVDNCVLFSDQGTCGTSTYRKITYFVSPTVSDVTALPTSCSYTVTAYNKNICQLRVDFDTFEIAYPTLSTNIIRCSTDDLTVTTSNGATIPVICGYNTGQHMYIPMNVSNGETSTTFTFHLTSRTTASTLVTPTWKMRIWQLECPNRPKYRGSNAEKDFLMLAPPGCLQYFTARTGIVRTFGFNPSTTTTTNLYTINLDYSICFRREPSTCGFRLYPGTFQMAPTSPNCLTDYMFVPEGYLDDGAGTLTQTNSRFCGTVLATGTSARSTGHFPAYIHVYSDGASTNAEVGFSLNYEIPPSGGC